MAQIDSRYAQAFAGTRAGVGADEGLRAHMSRVHNYMTGSVLLIRPFSISKGQMKWSNSHEFCCGA